MIGECVKTVIGQMAKIFEGYQNIPLKAGEIIVRPGDPVDYLYFVESGVMRQYSVSEAGEELTGYLYSPGSIFFMPWVYGLKENVYYFESLVESVVWRGPRRELGAKIMRDLALLNYMCGGAYVGLQVLMMHMESQVYGNAKRKIASVLCILEKFYGRRQNGKVEINIPLTHQLLSTIVGVTRETISLNLAKMRREKIVDYEGRIVKIINKGKLQQIASVSLDHIDFMVSEFS